MNSDSISSSAFPLKFTSCLGNIFLLTRHSYSCLNSVYIYIHIHMSYNVRFSICIDNYSLLLAFSSSLCDTFCYRSVQDFSSCKGQLTRKLPLLWLNKTVFFFPFVWSRLHTYFSNDKCCYQKNYISIMAEVLLFPSNFLMLRGVRFEVLFLLLLLLLFVCLFFP